MRRNIVPLHNNSRNKPSSNQRTIINHLNQIGSMFNAPSRAIPSRNIVPEPNVHNETESDDDYLDDYIYDENSDT
jgi:hypothetical protein